MTKTAQPPTADQLRDQAAELDRQAADAHAALQQVAAEEQKRQWQQLLDADRRLVETYSRRELDDAVDQALEQVKQAVADLRRTPRPHPPSQKKNPCPGLGPIPPRLPPTPGGHCDDPS